MLFFSLEMSQLELTQRLLCSEARVDATRMRNGKLNEADWKKISHAVGRLAEAPIWIDDNPNVTVMEIRSKARRLKSQVGDLGLVVVDYLQLMTGRTGAENRQVEVAEISRGLKILARELETPGHRPGPAQPRPRAARRQAPDAGRPPRVGLARAGRRRRALPLPRRGLQPRSRPDRGIAEVIVAKHRNGPTGHGPPRLPRPVHPLRQHGPQLTHGRDRGRTGTSARRGP